MRYIDLNSSKGFVNLFADYLLSYFDNTTVLEVSNCGPFWVVRGETELKTVVDLGPIKDKFLKEYPNHKFENLNIIDIITYNVDNNYQTKWFKYYNTVRPIYSETQLYKIENKEDSNKFEYPGMTITSQFPHGYGLDRGRFDYYFGEYVSNHIFNITNADSIELKYFPESVVENVILELDLENSLLSNDYIFDLLLDTFYTKENISEIRKIVDGYNVIDDLISPLSPKPWLIKNKIEDIVVF